MSTILITGANKGLGREAARRLIAENHSVLIGARNVGRGEAAATELGATFIQLDVTDQASVDAAAERIRAEIGHLDVLINNAGVWGGQIGTEGVTGDAMAAELDTNVVGVVRVTQAMLPLLARSTNPVVVNVSSGLGSFGTVLNPERGESHYPTIVYSATKAAVSMLTLMYARAVPEVKFNVIDPGFTATDLTGNTGAQSVQEGTEAMVRIATIGSDGPSGTFTDAAGTLPW
jgi:NAD(P)-dependent dehydrogenase (short-subunit alcohol dehydrogenase family)